ncbi:MAG: TIGR02302 family protein [Xanthobacteraceae bacterium]
MTEQHVVQPAEAKPAALPSRLAVAARRARYAILWERVWPPLAALVTAAGLFLALSWLGLWLWLPPLGRAAGLIAFGALTLWAAFPFVFLRLPGFADALHRLDRVSGLRHRPATTLADRLAVNAQDPYALALWNAHVARSLANADALRAGAPAPRVAGRDPYALRGLVLIAVLATFVAAGGERWHRVAAAFDWRGVVVPANFRVDAWVAPPAYTARPPIILPGIHPGETSTVALASNGPISVPVNSTLVVRATGNLKLDLSTTGGLVPSSDDGRAPAGSQEHRFTVTATGAATLRGAGENLVWPFNAIPDKPPSIALTKDPEQQSRGALLLSYRLEDDYGVAEAQATFARKDDPGAAGGHAARPLFGPPDFALVLPQARTKNGTGQTIKDLTDHPWAGAEVTMTLVARDDAGNEGRSEPFGFRLPERVFTKPLARALIEQRRNLALDANTRPRVGTALDALTMAPERFTKEAGIYLGLRSLYWSLERAKSDDDLRAVVKRLWQMAVGIEDGDMANAEEALRNAENALQQALDRGASDQELKALMEQLRAAMDRFLQAMAEQLKNNRELARPLSPNSRVLSSRDLQNMLDRLENLARSGAKDAARQLLQQLQEMMENLQAGMPEMNEGDEDMMSALDELGDMIHQQQQLRDRTFQQGQQQRQDRQRSGREGKPGQQLQPNGNSLGDLRQNQQALRDRLNKLLEDLKNRGLGQNDQSQQGQGAPGQGQEQLDLLGRAGEAMGDAAGNLGQGDADSAVDSQGRALDALRKGAQSLAQSMQQQMGRGPGPGRPGRFGQSRAQQDTDPLGRPLRGREYGDDSTVKVPGDIDVQRARRIIEELRKRFGDFARPQEELDYIERLLKNY